MSSHKIVSFILAATLLTIAFVLTPSQPAPAVASADPGVIAYVRRSTNDIHLISPDGAADQLLWTYPQPTFLWAPQDLAWRSDGRELAFSSEHEETCSLYQSDVYAIRYNGTGIRRITNSPACAELAALPKGSVTVDVTNYTSSLVQVYVQGAPSIQSVFSDGTVTIDNVADFGPGVSQPVVGIYGGYRIVADPPYADVQPGGSVPGGNLIITAYSGIDALGTGKVSWKADGSALAYDMRTYSRIRQIPTVPPYGSIGEDLSVVENAVPSLVAWGPTEATKDMYLYFSKDNWIAEGIEGIYLNTVGDDSGGTMLVYIDVLDGQMVYDIEWLPDASGFLFSATYIDLGTFTDIFRYEFGDPPTLTAVTRLPDDQGARALSISPDGQEVVFEWLPDIFLDQTSSLWITNSDGSGEPRWLANDAGRPAWGPSYIPEPVHAEFIGTPTSGVRPLPVQFTNSSTGDYDTCTWTFGDGETSSSCSNPTHTYATRGVYTVALTVSGPGGTDTLTRTDSITVYEPVQADFTGSPTSGPPPLTVKFTNSSTGDFTASLWDFGDGETSTLENPTHTYSDEETYTVTLTVSGPGGTDTRIRPGYIAAQSKYTVWLPLILSSQSTR